MPGTAQAVSGLKKTALLEKQHKENFMADKLATYAFTNKESYDAAKYKIRDELGDSSWSGDNNCYLLHILSDCDNPSRAADICSAYGGTPY
jgi:hypothetical protein